VQGPMRPSPMMQGPGYDPRVVRVVRRWCVPIIPDDGCNVVCVAKGGYAPRYCCCNLHAQLVCMREEMDRMMVRLDADLDESGSGFIASPIVAQGQAGSDFVADPVECVELGLISGPGSKVTSDMLIPNPT